MKFIYYDLIFLVLFSLFVGIFLYKNRKKLQRDGLMYLYKTRVGMRIIDSIGGKYKKTLRFLSYVSVTCGYFLMVIMLYLLGQLVYVYVKNPEIVRAVKIPPLIPLVPYLPEIFKLSFLPPFYFTYWIIAIAVVAIFHEFSHGIFMKRYGIRIKSTGFGFLGPFLAAFVEQDDVQMKKKKKFEQLAVLSAGTFMNLILSIIFFFLLSLFFVLAYAPAGAMFNTYTPYAVQTNQINMIDGENVNNMNNEDLINILDSKSFEADLVLDNEGVLVNLTKITAGNKSYYSSLNNLKEQLTINSSYVVLYADFPAINNGLKGAIIEIDSNSVKTFKDLSEIMKNYSPGDNITLKTKYNGEIKEYNVILAEDYSEAGKPVIGIGVMKSDDRLIMKIYNFFNFFKEDWTFYEARSNSNLIIFIYNLIWWLALVNVSVALANMLPMGLFDGGRFFMLTVQGITGSKRAGEIAFKITTYLLLFSFLVLMVGWAFAFIF